MSEQGSSNHFSLWVALVAAWIMSFILAFGADSDKKRIRDLQRRVGQLESEKR